MEAVLRLPRMGRSRDRCTSTTSTPPTQRLLKFCPVCVMVDGCRTHPELSDLLSAIYDGIAKMGPHSDLCRTEIRLATSHFRSLAQGGTGQLNGPVSLTYTSSILDTRGNSSASAAPTPGYDKFTRPERPTSRPDESDPQPP